MNPTERYAPPTNVDDVPFYGEVPSPDGKGTIMVQTERPAGFGAAANRGKITVATAVTAPLEVAQVTITVTPPVPAAATTVRSRNWKRIACYGCIGTFVAITGLSLYLTFK